MKYTLPTAMILILSAMLLTGCPGAPETPPELSPELAAGKAIVEKTCIACHDQGLNGAPILGNKKMWSKRLPQGEEVLVSHAINGFAMEMMPPKGGNPDLSDDDVRNAVLYMLSLVQ